MKRVLSEKLINVRLVKKYPNIQYNKKYFIVFTAAASGLCLEPERASAQTFLAFL
jgi:hypothetical protein